MFFSLQTAGLRSGVGNIAALGLLLLLLFLDDVLLLPSLHVLQLERGQPLQGSKSFLLGSGSLLEGLVLLYQVLHLVDGPAELLRLQVRILGQQPGSLPEV